MIRFEEDGKKYYLNLIQECERFWIKEIQRYTHPEEIGRLKEARSYIEDNSEIPDELLEQIAIDLWEGIPYSPINNASNLEETATRAFLALHILRNCVNQSLTHLAIFLEEDVFRISYGELEPEGVDLEKCVNLKYIDSI
jgi:hypothetical protein